jgi:hypothetical protein
MLPIVTSVHVDLWLCGKRNFKRRRRLSPYTFFYQCCVAFCGRSCAEEEDEAVVYVSSSFMLPGEGCVGVGAQLFLMATTSDMGRNLF